MLLSAVLIMLKPSYTLIQYFVPQVPPLAAITALSLLGSVNTNTLTHMDSVSLCLQDPLQQDEECLNWHLQDWSPLVSTSGLHWS